MIFNVRNREDSRRVWLSFFLLFGSAAGTVFCNRMDGDMKETLGSLRESFSLAASFGSLNFQALLLGAAKRRLSLLFVCFLGFPTAAAPFLFSALAAWLGFSTAVLVCTLTMDGGLFGIVRVLAVLFPQWLFYVPAMYLLAVWLPEQNIPLSLRPAVAATALVFLGILAESLVNPWVLAIFL